jgi:hypothetical protein
MKKADAEIIKVWRCDRGCSWRRIAELAQCYWPEWRISRGTQKDGARICEQAAEMLGEDPGDEPWN